jgi:hypothetical protein
MDDMWKFDPIAQTWSNVLPPSFNTSAPSSLRPLARSGSTTWRYNDDLYLFGGLIAPDNGKLCFFIY